MKNTISYYMVVLIFIIVFSGNTRAQQISSLPQKSLLSSGSEQELRDAIALKQQEIKDMREQMNDLQEASIEMHNNMEGAKHPEYNLTGDELDALIAGLKEQIDQLLNELADLQNELQRLHSGQQAAVNSLADFGPVSGNSTLFLKAGTRIRDQYQLIPVKNKNDAQQLKSYLSDLLSTDFDGTFAYNTTTVAWAFISSVDENIIYHEPYLYKDKVWFDISPKKAEANDYLSVWFFHMPAGLDFRVYFNGSDLSAEMSCNTLLAEYFKKGTKKEQTVGAFQILSSGEYFDDTIQFISAQGTRQQKEFGNVSYLDALEVKIGSMFGIEYSFLGRMTRNYNFKFINPPYLSGPEKGTTEFMMSKQCSPGRKDNFIWKFTEDYELVSGNWELQILDGGALIYKKNFTISVKQPVMQVRSLNSGVKNPGSGLRVQIEQDRQRDTPKNDFSSVLNEGMDKKLTIFLTRAQRAALAAAKGKEVIVKLTEWQFAAILKIFPKLKNKTMTITPLTTNVAAPIIPGGTVISAAVTGVGFDGGAKASVSYDEEED